MSSKPKLAYNPKATLATDNALEVNRQVVHDAEYHQFRVHQLDQLHRHSTITGVSARLFLFQVLQPRFGPALAPSARRRVPDNHQNPWHLGMARVACHHVRGGRVR